MGFASSRLCNDTRLAATWHTWIKLTRLVVRSTAASTVEKRAKEQGHAPQPTPASEYNSITNLQDLVELHVAYCTNFTDQQLALITNLPNLRSIELRADALSSQATNILSGMGTLTNVVIKPSRP